MTDYKPGMFVLVPVNGPVGEAIKWSQFFAGAPSRYQHAALILDGDGTLIEAEPGKSGARIANVSEYAGRDFRVCDPVAWMIRGLSLNASEDQLRAKVADEGRKLEHVRYSALDYAALILLHLEKLLTRRKRPTWRLTLFIRKRVQSSGHLICSQLVDLALSRAGLSLFTDGRLPGDVMPADLDGWANDWDLA